MNTIASLPTLRVAVLGSGTVGTEVVRALREDAEELAARSGAHLQIDSIVVRDTTRPRDPVIPTDLLSTDAEAAVAGADLVVEVMGGIEPARGLKIGRASCRKGWR